MSPEATHRLTEQNKTRAITVTKRTFSGLKVQDLRILFKFMTQHPGEAEFPRCVTEFSLRKMSMPSINITPRPIPKNVSRIKLKNVLLKVLKITLVLPFKYEAQTA